MHMIEWMGRYRPVVAALVQHSNAATKGGRLHHIFEDIYLSPNEWQVLEYIVEHREDDEHMANMISARAIPQSSFSRIQKKLCSMGLLERFQMQDNKKNVILKPTGQALKAYDYHSAALYGQLFKPFFDELEGFSDEELNRFARAIENLSGRMESEEPKKTGILVKIEPVRTD